MVTANGYGKRTPLSDYRMQRRSGSGIKTAKITSKTGPIVNASLLDKSTIDQTDVLIISEKGQVIRVAVASISQQGRATQGVRVMRATGDTGKVATFTTWSAASE
jgi:DNA gyrase subunit A